MNVRGRYEPNSDPSAAVVVTGAGRCVVEPDAPCDPLPYLKVKKYRKYMGIQDDVAIVAASHAISSAGLANATLGERAGLYLAVGYIPFERRDLMSLAEASTDDGQFSMQRLSTTGFHAVNGLLTFQCLPNMPAFHVSANLDIQGPYFVTYPGPGQWYLALEQAWISLTDGTVDVAIVIGVAHQRNFLVQHHYARLSQPVPPAELIDAAACLVLERRQDVALREGPLRGLLRDLRISYRWLNPFTEEHSGCEVWNDLRAIAPSSCAAIPLQLVRRIDSGPGSYRHHLESRDGIQASSVWEIP